MNEIIYQLHRTDANTGRLTESSPVNRNGLIDCIQMNASMLLIPESVFYITETVIKLQDSIDAEFFNGILATSKDGVNWMIEKGGEDHD